MKRTWFFVVFSATQILIVFLIIYKYARFMQATVAFQRLEQKEAHLLKERDHRIQQLYTLQNKAHIRQYATSQLGMKKIALKDIQTVDDEKRI